VVATAAMSVRLLESRCLDVSVYMTHEHTYAILTPTTQHTPHTHTHHTHAHTHTHTHTHTTHTHTQRERPHAHVYSPPHTSLPLFSSRTSHSFSTPTHLFHPPSFLSSLPRSSVLLPLPISERFDHCPILLMVQLSSHRHSS